MEDAVANDLPAGVATDELLRPARREVRERVDRHTRQELPRVGPREEQLRHVVRLIEQYGGLAPSTLFVTPVAELERHGRSARIGPRMRSNRIVEQIVDEVRTLVQQILKRFVRQA